VNASLEAHSDTATFHEIRARALEASGADREAVRACFERAIELLSAHGRSKEVERRLEAMLKGHPYYGRAADRLARHLVARGESLDRALNLSRRALRFQAGPQALGTLGWVQLERGEFEASIEALERALVLRPDAPSTRYRLGRALAADGQMQAARDALHRALEAESFPEREQAAAELARLETGGEAAR
jgi:tetratricopeptide (TPR) repeat protein